MIELGAWLQSNLHRHREPGLWDCCAFPAEWCVINGWSDPMAHWRGAYDSEEGALALIAGAGGLKALFQQGMASAGIAERHGKVLAGDVGVLRIGKDEAGAIYTGRRWAFAAVRGIGFASVEEQAVSAAWSMHG